MLRQVSAKKGTIRDAILCVVVLLRCCVAAAAQLPPKTLVEECLLLAERRVAGGNHGGVIDALDRLDALLKEHRTALSDTSRLRYARAALKAGATQHVIDALEPHLAAADTAGTFFREAKALLVQAEQLLPLEPAMVVIPVGRFRMGCVSGRGCWDNEKPVREVSIALFELSRYEVTFAEYDRFAAATGRERARDAGWGRGRRPVINVSWEDAVAYTQWLSSKTGKRYRLPNEAEWEYAARAGTTGERYGADLGAIAWYRKNSSGRTHPVGGKAPNAYGLHDMLGNVMEWVQDCWNENYAGVPSDGSAWESGDCSMRVLRSAAWDHLGWEVRAAKRGGISSGYRSNITGFRVARTLTP